MFELLVRRFEFCSNDADLDVDCVVGTTNAVNDRFIGYNTWFRLFAVAVWKPVLVDDHNRSDTTIVDDVGRWRRDDDLEWSKEHRCGFCCDEELAV